MKFQIIKTLPEFYNLYNEIQDYEYISYDTETNGTDKDAKIIGFSVCGSLDKSFYVILRSWNKETQTLDILPTLEVFDQFIEKLKNHKLVMHNAVFDCFITNCNTKIDLMPSVFCDTLILAHLLDENRRNGLKELGASLFGDDVKDEQRRMKESVIANGGVLTEDKYELYKGDAELIGQYGAQDAMLTLKLFYTLMPELFEQNLDKFFFDEESMLLLRGPTYELNTTGLRVDPTRLQNLKGELEAECMEQLAFINNEVNQWVKSKYPGGKKSNTFNVNSNNQLCWLLFEKLGNYFQTLTDGGKEFCKDNNIPIPYTNAAKRQFIDYCRTNIGSIYHSGKLNKKTGKVGKPLGVKDFWKYTSGDKHTLAVFKDKYKWVDTLLKYSKNQTILNTYVIGVQKRMRYNVINPRFAQNGTTAGRYSSFDPNFQNLPRDDKRVKYCIVARPGKSFVGADYSQLEPRVFASMSKDETLMNCFATGEDFYSVVGAPIYGIKNLSLRKDDPNSFAKKHPKLRDQAKVIALATPYGRTASFTASQMKITRQEAQDIMDKYFTAYPKVELMMLDSHEQAKSTGIVYSLFGRPRRIPAAKEIREVYGDSDHNQLPYAIRTLLNLGMNHRVQSTAASIINRASIAFYNAIKFENIKECHIVMQVHDELIIECLDEDAERVASILKYCMEQTTELPGVKLEAIPKIGKDLSELK